jgi:hypothetical protein
MLAGLLEILFMAGHAATGGRTYLGGPLGLRGVATIYAFVALGALITAPWQPPSMVLSRFVGLANIAFRSPTFFGLMALIHLNLAGLNLAIGYGLRRRQPWARRAQLGLMGFCLPLTILHGAAIARLRLPREQLALIGLPLAVAVLVAASSLAVMGTPGMAAFFRAGPVHATARRGERRRHWSGATVQFLLALLMGAFAAGILILLTFGPLAEIAWACARLIVYL